MIPDFIPLLIFDQNGVFEFTRENWYNSNDLHRNTDQCFKNFNVLSIQSLLFIYVPSSSWFLIPKSN